MWNSYKFFIDYAVSSNWSCDQKRGELTILDKWILARLTGVVLKVNGSLEKYDGATASRVLEDFIVSDFSTWFIRRSRDRVGFEAKIDERSTALSIMYGVLVTISKLLAPFMPFISEQIYKNLTEGESVHLEDYPLGDKSLLNDQLVEEMVVVRKIAEATHAKRKEANIKLRQPLASVGYSGIEKLSPDLEQLLSEELNVKKVEYKKSSKEDLEVILDTKITKDLAQEGEARDLIRQIQQLRKEQNLTLADKTKIISPSWPKAFESQIISGTASVSITKGETLQVIKV